MDVKVRHCLARSATVVDTDIESIRVKLTACCRLGLIQQLQQRCALLRAGLEERPDVPFRDNQAVPWRHGKTVADPECMSVLTQHTLRRQTTKWTRLGSHLSYPTKRRNDAR